MINKKAVAVLGAILLLIIGTVGFLIYQRSQNSESTDVLPPPPPPENTFPPPDDIFPPFEPPIDPTPVLEPPPQPQASASRLTESEVLSPVLFYQGNGIAYLNSQGQLFQAEMSESSGSVTLNNLQELVIPQRSGIARVLWPDSGNNFILERQEGTSKRYSVYMSDRGEYVDLPPQVTELNWMPGGNQILYVWLEQDKSTLNIANADNTGWQTITDFWELDNAISVPPDGRGVAFYETSNQNEPNKLNLVTIDGKVFKAAVGEGHNTGALWSPDSRSIVFLKLLTNGEKRLWVVSANTGEVKDLGVRVDSLNKVVWSHDSKWIYAGGMSDVGDSLAEQLTRIDVATGNLQTFDTGVSTDIREPFLNSTGSLLFFRNAADGNKLYYVNVGGQMDTGSGL